MEEAVMPGSSSYTCASLPWAVLQQHGREKQPLPHGWPVLRLRPCRWSPSNKRDHFTQCNPPIYSSAPLHGHKSANSCWSRRMWILEEDLIEKVESRVFTEGIHYVQLWFSKLLNGKLGPINQYCFSLHMILLRHEMWSSNFRLSVESCRLETVLQCPKR